MKLTIVDKTVGSTADDVVKAVAYNATTKADISTLVGTSKGTMMKVGSETAEAKKIETASTVDVNADLTVYVGYVKVKAPTAPTALKGETISFTTNLGTWTGDKVVAVNTQIKITFTVTSATATDFVTNGYKVVVAATNGDKVSPASKIWAAANANGKEANTLTQEFTTKTLAANDITAITATITDASN